MKKIALALGLIALVAAAPALAAAGDMKLRFGGAYSNPTGDYYEVLYDEPPYFEEQESEAAGAFGGFVGFEFYITDWFGLDGTVLYTSHDVDAEYREYMDDILVYEEDETIGDVDVTPLFLSAHFHFLRSAPVDLYAGPTIGYVMYSDLKFQDWVEEDDIPFKNDFGYGAVFGIDVPFGSSSNWMFSSAVRYIKSGAETDEAEDNVTVDIDPVILQVGVGVKF